MRLKPWYNVVFPREDLQSGRPLDASQFAVHLDKVKAGEGDATYYKPEEFFARTYLTPNLLGFSAEVMRRLSGESTGASPVFNMATQFGGGKTHALTLVYHLAQVGPASASWPGVRQIMEQARVPELPKAKTAIFVGMNFDPRGGDDGTPLRRTPWGDIAWQLGGPDGYGLFAKFDQQNIVPGGETIGKLFDLVDQPILILTDELMNYMSRYRHVDNMGEQVYNFLFNLSNEVASRNSVVLAISVPRSEGEMNAEDIGDYERLLHMLQRLSKEVPISVGPDTAEIIRRRLFDWDESQLTADGRVRLTKDAVNVCNAYADWVQEHKSMLPSDFDYDMARERFKSTYPFHPAVLSVFERKWQTIPNFQRTRGVLRLLALWVAHAYDEGVNRRRRGKGDPLLTLGMAPLDNSYFRQDVFGQLGEAELQNAVTTDIIGGSDAHAMRLDDEATGAIKNVQLHRKVATSIFFESNGGQSSQRAYATMPEIRMAVGDPSLDIGNVETVLESLAPPNGVCFYLDTQDRGYWFSTKANLTRVLARKRGEVRNSEIDNHVRQAIQKQFGEPRRNQLTCHFFPDDNSAIPNRPSLALVVLPPNRALRDRDATQRGINDLVRNYGNAARVYKSALLFAVADSDTDLRDAARTYLAWEMIDDERDRHQFSDSQLQQLTKSLRSSRENLNEAVWRTYHTVIFLGPDKQLTTRDMGRQNSTAATSLSDLIVRELQATDDVSETIGPGWLVRRWPPALTEWSIKGVRDAFYASPQFPRLLNSDAIKECIAKGVANGILAYVGKAEGGGYGSFQFERQITPQEIDFLDDMYIITRETAEAYQATMASPAPATPEPQPPTVREGESPYSASTEQPTSSSSTEPQPGASPAQPDLLGGDDQPGSDGAAINRITWQGEIPAQKWANFYMKVLARFASNHQLTLTVRAEIVGEQGISQQRIDELKSALRDLGLGDEVEIS